MPVQVHVGPLQLGDLGVAEPGVHADVQQRPVPTACEVGGAGVENGPDLFRFEPRVSAGADVGGLDVVKPHGWVGRDETGTDRPPVVGAQHRLHRLDGARRPGRPGQHPGEFLPGDVRQRAELVFDLTEPDAVVPPRRVGADACGVFFQEAGDVVHARHTSAGAVLYQTLTSVGSRCPR